MNNKTPGSQTTSGKHPRKSIRSVEHQGARRGLSGSCKLAGCGAFPSVLWERPFPERLHAAQVCPVPKAPRPVGMCKAAASKTETRTITTRDVRSASPTPPCSRQDLRRLVKSVRSPCCERPDALTHWACNKHKWKEHTVLFHGPRSNPEWW